MYCVKCRSKKPGKDIKVIQLVSGRKVQEGMCEECGTRMIKVGKELK